MENPNEPLRFDLKKTLIVIPDDHFAKYDGDDTRTHFVVQCSNADETILRQRHPDIYLKGLALSSIGEYKKAEEAHLKSLQIDRNFLEAWAHLTQSAAAAQELEVAKDEESCRDPLFRYVSHVRSYPTFMFGGSVGSRVATVAFLRK
ncbi:Tetratricopeptide-like helical domain superfamily [Sesbania bispinosa]|nr:Tetratricopeptide-like helical domain superfamily [Sesbania bispinosa]